MAETEKKRGILLTAWLILMLLANAGVAIIYFLFSGLVIALIPTMSWVIYIVGFLSLLNIVFTIFLFKWKKWAFFAFCAMAGIMFVINILIGTGISSVLGFLGPVILWLLLRSKWNYLE